MIHKKLKSRKIETSESVKTHLHFLDHFFRIEQNEELQSEQRIKFFLTLITIIIGLLSWFKYNGDNSISFEIVALSLFLLFLFGLLVFARIIWSDRKIKQHRKLWTVSSEAIKKIDPSIEEYRNQLNGLEEIKFIRPLRVLKGTLTQIIWFTEGLLIGGSVYFLGRFLELSTLYIIILVLSVTGFVLCILFFWSRYVKRGINT